MIKTDNILNFNINNNFGTVRVIQTEFSDNENGALFFHIQFNIITYEEVDWFNFSDKYDFTDEWEIMIFNEFDDTCFKLDNKKEYSENENGRIRYEYNFIKRTATPMITEEKCDIHK